jgi:hypothetical protein
MPGRGSRPCGGRRGVAAWASVPPARGRRIDRASGSNVRVNNNFSCCLDFATIEAVAAATRSGSHLSAPRARAPSCGCFVCLFRRVGVCRAWYAGAAFACVGRLAVYKPVCVLGDVRRSPAFPAAGPTCPPAHLPPLPPSDARRLAVLPQGGASCASGYARARQVSGLGRLAERRMRRQGRMLACHLALRSRCPVWPCLPAERTNAPALGAGVAAPAQRARLGRAHGAVLEADSPPPAMPAPRRLCLFCGGLSGARFWCCRYCLCASAQRAPSSILALHATRRAAFVVCALLLCPLRRLAMVLLGLPLPVGRDVRRSARLVRRHPAAPVRAPAEVVVVDGVDGPRAPASALRRLYRRLSWRLAPDAAGATRASDS